MAPKVSKLMRRAVAPGSCRHVVRRLSVSTSTLALQVAQPMIARRRQEHGIHPRAASTRGYATLGSAGSWDAWAGTPPPSVAVLGGGLTGLVTAWYVTRYCPNTRITIYEASGRLGGWLETETRDVDVGHGRKGKLFFERGARTVKTQTQSTKYDDLVLFELIYRLNLNDKLRYSLRRQDLMRRYIYYPDHLVDVSGPDLSSPLRILAWLWAKCSDLAREPLYQNALPSLIAYTQHRRRAKPAPRALRPSYPLQHVPDDVIKDLSVGEYFTKAMGGRRDVVDNMISALMHGVYAADVWQQSMQSSIFSSLLMDEYAPGRPSHVRLDLQEWYLALELTAHDDGFRKAATTLSRAEYLSFHGGFTTLTDAIAADLRSNKNVTIRLNEPVTQIRNYQHKVAVSTSRRPTQEYYDKIVSTILAQQLAALTNNKLPTLAQSKATSVALVNLWYPEPDLDKGAHGFGYLIPSSSMHNPNALLGVLFDSDREAMFNARHRAASAGEAAPGPVHDAPNPGGTKLTVMMGGHLWGDLPREHWPDEARAIDMAKEAVAAQLPGLAAAKVPPLASAKLSWDCIPRHDVGHFGRMRAARDEIDRAFGGRLAVAGGSYQLPGVLPSLRAGRDMAAQMAGHFQVAALLAKTAKYPLNPIPLDVSRNEVFWSPGVTGLGRFGTEMLANYLLLPPRALPYRYLT